MDDYQKYKVKGLDDQKTAELVISTLEEAGYYQCTADFQNSTLIIPISFAGYIDDIERILLSIGFEFIDN